ncbi:rhamnan synthesis F family protein (plasmid) [Bartonella sp. HY329]|uniref:rhamnan synthesis F family protein n=1 Tax=unclassified Bartonella TaxID=2645622 RepID=UPI0021CAC03D|nr:MULTISPECIES: rhamnan synthesis F family protein [unclassified Bartonella]UXM96450.1 rhamnan synthesis F family protein [Bartonella sp. HY329]UXN10773.1 rhamnan synthesis F family protein [Bartonella sp. HY328]
MYNFILFNKSKELRDFFKNIIFKKTSNKLEVRNIFKFIVYKKNGCVRKKYKYLFEKTFDIKDKTINKAVNSKVIKLDNIPFSSDILFYVAYSRDGTITDLQHKHIQAYSDAEYEVVVIINSDNFDKINTVSDNAAKAIILRENIGFDFGAWKDALSIIGNLERANTLTFTNDSIFIVEKNNSIKNQKKIIEKNDLDISFLTENNEIKKHYQSFFFSIKRKAIENDALSILKSIPYYKDKQDLIYSVEIELHNLFNRKNLNCGHIYKDDRDFARNPTIWHWKELIDIGFPFVKSQIAFKIIDGVDYSNLDNYLPKNEQILINEHYKSRFPQKMDS